MQCLPKTLACACIRYIHIRYIHITSPCFVAIKDLLNSTQYSEKLHFSLEVPINYTIDGILDKETESLFTSMNHFYYH